MAAPYPLSLIQVHLHAQQPGKPVLELPPQEHNSIAITFPSWKLRRLKKEGQCKEQTQV